MTEVLFLITTVFVAYVVYVIINEKKGENAKSKPTSAAKPAQAVMPEKAKPVNTSPAKAEPAAAKAAVSKPAPAKAAPKPAPVKKAPVSKPAAAAEPAAVGSSKSKGLKDPRTGEVVSTYSNYRFTKRWIKEALVAEGLVDKIYKNDELNSAIEANIKSAIGKLEAIKKYQP